MSAALPTIPPDNPERTLTLAQLDNLPHIGLVGDTYTITVTGEQTAGRFCMPRNSILRFWSKDTGTFTPCELTSLISPA